MERKHNSKLTTLARNLRKNMTREEKHLWYDFLKDYPVRFLKQKVIDNYIVDFYCHDAKLIIELDGSQHFEEEGREKDIERDEELNRLGVKVLKKITERILKEVDGVCRVLYDLSPKPSATIEWE